MASPELLIGVGMSAGQIAALNRAGLSQLLQNVPRVGAKGPRVINAAGGLFVLGQQPGGDFSGTLQQINAWRPDEAPIYGSGGPAHLPYSPTGYDTVPGMGRLLADGADTTHFTAEQTPGNFNTGWLYRCKIRSMRKTIGAEIASVNWTAATFTLNKAGLVASCADDGDTWAHITANTGTGGLTGWFRVKTTSGADDVILTPDRHDASRGQAPGAGDALVCATDVAAGITVRFHNSNQSTLVPLMTWRDKATYSLPLATLPSNGDTFTVGGVTYTWKTTAGASPDVQIGATRVISISNALAVVTLNPNVTVVSTTTVSITFRSTSTTTYATTESTGGARGTWNVSVVGNKLLVANAGTPFSAYTPTANDTAEIREGSDNTGTAITNLTVLDTRIVAKVSSTTIQVADENMSVEGASNLRVVVFNRKPFEDVACSWTSSGTAITLGSALTFTPKQGDFYYIYVNGTDGTEVIPWNPQPRNNPEEAPTRSQLSSKFSAWPIHHLGRSSRAANKTQAGFGNLIAAVSGTLMNHAWWGSLITTPRSFLSGDELTVEIGPIDTTSNGTPFCLEVVLIPNHDPARHYRLEGTVGASLRLFADAVCFHSPPFGLGQIRPISLSIRGIAGAVQTTNGDEGGDNLSQEWTCEFRQGPNAAGRAEGGTVDADPRFPAKRLVTKTIDLPARVFNGIYTPGATPIVNRTGAFVRYAGDTALPGDVLVVEHGTGWKQGIYYLDVTRTNAQTGSAHTDNIYLLPGQPGMPSSACSDLVGYVPDRTDFHNHEIEWQIFVQAIHPCQVGVPLVHAYYPGEPFDCLTGNGGVLLGCFGSQFNTASGVNVKLPTAPRMRCSSFRHRWSPGGGA
jgi:hypothetical protein